MKTNPLDYHRILVYGPPGSGKTRNAYELQRLYACRYLFEVDALSLVTWRCLDYRPDRILFLGQKPFVKDPIDRRCRLSNVLAIPVWQAAIEVGSRWEGPFPKDPSIIAPWPKDLDVTESTTISDLPIGTHVVGLAPIGVPWVAVKNRLGLKPVGNCPRSEFSPLYARIGNDWKRIVSNKPKA